ncbi:sialidase family protein [Brachyspira aalborgi]|uniref:exo-alpha-sialidase n=1 Tax=Brachyspira aalborgi TaxID=29522 RepID=A0A5C8EQY1_9SPIR|nr:sialidase family protein [Brachyspira aalborgi]TXJ39494.1 exo-alpha-sialidase [Brachyspira aalborgi]
MRKKYFLISFSLIAVVGVLIWACKYNLGPDGLDFSLLRKSGAFADGLIGYNGQITYKSGTRLNPSMDNAVEVFPFQDGTAYYRIPSLVVTTNGTLLAFADRRYNNRNDLPNRIEVEVKRSTDNGKKWSKRIRVTPRSVSDTDGHGDVATVVNRKTGEILALVASGPGFVATAGQSLISTPNTPMKIILFKSSDDGKTWSAGEDITSQIYGTQCKVPTRTSWYAAFVTSGNGLQLSTGRIIFVINVRENKQTGITTFKNYALYSDDGGKTWSVSKNGPQNNLGGNESKIVELVDGRLLMSTRPNSGNKRMHAYSSDGGETWTKAEPKSDITVASSNGDMIYYTSTKNGWDKNRIIHFIPTSTITVSGEGQYNGRRGPSEPYFYYSFDDGQTFTKSQAIRNGQQAGYSSLAVLHDGSIGVLFEDKSWGGPIKFMRVNFEWLTKGKDNPTKKNK